MKRFRPFSQLLLGALLIALVGTPKASAQVPAIVSNGYRNAFGTGLPIGKTYLDANGVRQPLVSLGVDAPVGAPLLDSYRAQRQNGTAFGGFPINGYGTLDTNTDAPTAYSATAVAYPKSLPTPQVLASVELRSAIIGRPVAVFNISYNFGGEIPVPTEIDLATGDAIPDFYRAEPLNARLKTRITSATDLTPIGLPVNATAADVDGIVQEGGLFYLVAQNPEFYWSKHAKKVYATQPGTITVQWREALSTNSLTKTYAIASAPDKAERTIYWTENGFNGPLIEVPAGRVNAVNVIFNTLVPKEVVTPYEPWIAGATDFTETDPAKRRYKTFYYETNLIHAYNVEGRVFVEYLGNPRGDGTNEPKGTEIVNIIKEATPGTRVVDIGDEVGPDPIADSSAGLSPEIISGLGLDGQPYLHQQISAGGTKTTLYGIRETQPGVVTASGKTQQISNEVLVYWLETSPEGKLDLKWPKQYIGYVLEWPSNPEKYSVYARPDASSAGGSETAIATAVQLDSTNNPALVYQDDPTNTQAVLAPGNLFYSLINTTDPDNRALLRFSKDDDTWFERVYSKLDVNFSGLYDISTTLTLDQGAAPLTQQYASLTVSDPAAPGRILREGTDYTISHGPGGDILRSGTTFGANIDPYFNPGAGHSVQDIKVQPDGKILVGGYFTNLGGSSRSYIGRLNADGTLDTTFSSHANYYVNVIAVQPDGKVLVGGQFSALGGSSRSYIGRLNADGTVDADFNPVANNTVYAIVVQPDGKILIGGFFTTIGGQPRNRIARLNADGTIDAGFDPGADSMISGLALQPDGKILVGGHFDTLAGQPRERIGRLYADGTLDIGFNPGASDLVSEFAVQPDGKILVAGSFMRLGGSLRSKIGRLNANGTLDITFDPGATGSVANLTLQPDGKILVGGFFTTLGGQPRNYLGRLNADGTLDTSFNPGADAAVMTLAVQSDGKILVGGSFTNLGGQPRSRIGCLVGDLLLPSAIAVTFSKTATADIGTRISPLGNLPFSPYGDDSIYVGYIHQSTGTAFNVNAYKDPFVAGFDEAAKGAIIGVNALAGNDELEVWWYRKSTPSGSLITGTYWPSFVQKYKLRWPDAPDQIDLASNIGSGELPGLQATGEIYTQNDPAKTGYNPNEEHARILNGRVWALRDDLNVPTSSEPFVLLQYTGEDQRPAMRVFEVQRGDFTYPAVAGKILQSPMPLPLLPPPLLPDRSLASYEMPGSNLESSVSSNLGSTDAAFAHYQKFTWTDRKGIPWVYRGPHAGNAASQAQAPTLKMRYFYNTLGGFNFPSLAIDQQPEIGTLTPYLRAGTPGNYVGDAVYGVSGTGNSTVRGTQPLDITFIPQWPGSAPELRIGETLTLPKLGLPSVRGQASAELIYQQSVAKDTTPGMVNRKKSVRLFDPTRAKVYPLSPTSLPAIPDSINTSLYLGKTYFPNLPPHLSGRLYYDPAVGAHGSLVFTGEFMDEAVGEKYLQLNVLSEADTTAAKALTNNDDTNKAKWDAAIDGLSTTMETFIEDPAKRGTFIALRDESITPRPPAIVNGTPLQIQIGAEPRIATALSGTNPAGSQRPPVLPSELAEVYYSDTAVDSYAISASGGGNGYVVLAVGNGKDTDFTPQGQPVSLQVFKVNAPLYRGELKVINSQNPLDEKLTLQHTGDFAGHPEEYDFEWRYAPPLDGLPPKLYSFVRKLISGDGNDWHLINNPSSNALDPAQDYTRFRSPTADASSYPVKNLPNTPITINDGNGTGENGTTLPNALLRRTFSATERPLRLFLSIDLGPNDGAVVYLNNAPVAAYNAPGYEDTITISVPTTAPPFAPLTKVFEIDSNALVANGTPNNNVFTVELFTTADAGSTTSFNLRLEGQQEVENLTGWLSLTAAGDQKSPDSPHGTFSVTGKNRHIIEGTSILTLSDNWIIMRYRAKSSSNAAYVSSSGGWSKWTEPQLAEGWIKRVLAGINPFQQRVKDLFNHETNTSVSLVEQAGKRWEGDIALNLDNINDSGLIEIYETVLRRGKDLSITGTPAINYGGANDALLLAAGYLSDLYMILGNDAYADASNSTIAFNTNGQAAQYGDVATALFSFKGQLATVLDEELALLRGSDDFLLPGTKKSPIYNRLIWNYTRGIDSGEAIYALNYNIKDRTWDYSLNPNNPGDLPADGIISAADAAISYPQGHGDAYGHYLTALTGYYGLLNNPNFTWTPRIEAVLVLGTPVSVDYQDERKFAAATVAVARTAAQVVDLTYRQEYSASENAGWDSLREEKSNSNTGLTRNWGTDDWACRGGQGALFNWVTANSLLPATDPNPNHSGIQKIDRTTVPELAEIAAQATSIQQSLDNADAHLNPLGVADGALAFDISPSAVDAGKTHYEQIYERATVALQNAVSAFNNAKGSTQFLRQQEDTLEDQRNAIDAQEQAYTNQLIELYGTPYTDDIGPGKTYKQNYAGPDLLHSMYVTLPEIFNNDLSQTSYTLLLDPKFAADNSDILVPGTSVSYTLNSKGEVVKPATWTGRRVSPGQMQTTVSNLLLARQAAANALSSYQDLEKNIGEQIGLYRSAVLANNLKNSASVAAEYEGHLKDLLLASLNSAKSKSELAAQNIRQIATNAADSLPRVLGVANDASAAARAAILKSGEVAAKIPDGFAEGTADTISNIEIAQKVLDQVLKTTLEGIEWNNTNKQLLYELQSSLEELKGSTTAVDVALRHFDQAQRDLYALQAQGDRIQQQRLVFRQHAAAIIQGYRTRDFAFRSFRDEALERYKALFDLSARYTYLAASAYDYETGLLDANGNASASGFYEKIVQARALGVVSDGVPQFAGASTGDPGLSGVLAELAGDWSVAKTRLGFNNPDRYATTFSLRGEKFRLVPGVDGDLPWRDKLSSYKMADILEDPDVKRYCMQVADPNGNAVPGIVIPFSSTIATGYNFFGQPLAGGDHTFTPSSFSTKIRSSGLAFRGYVGMDSPTTTSGALGDIGATSPSTYNSGFSDADALSATPYVYLIPAGVDSMRSPPLGDSSFVRSWAVQDQAIPLPFNIANSDYSTQPAWVSAASLSEPAFTLRKHQAFRAVPDGTNFQGGYGFTNARLIGRSAWNSQWKIVIPGNTLLNNPNLGINTFINTVKDIKLHLETYSYSGN